MASTLGPTWRRRATAVAAEVTANLHKHSPPVAPKWLDGRSAAAYLSLTDKALRIRLYKKNPPPSHQVGNLLRFKRSDSTPG